MKKIFYAIFIFALFVSPLSFADTLINKQLGYTWYTIETEHFFIHFNRSTEFTARKIAKIADDTYTKVTTRYDYPLNRKIHIVISDSRDGSNGFALYSYDLIMIEPTNLYTNTFNLRGRSDWIKNVLTHEFAHIVGGKAGSIFGDRVATFGFSPFTLQDRNSLPYLDTKLPDYEIFGIFRLDGWTTPYWWVEGIAQYDTSEFKRDSFDSHREMFLRMAFLEDTVLDPNEMATPQALKKFYGELGYCMGFSLTKFMGEKFGTDIHVKIDKLVAEKAYKPNMTMIPFIEEASGEKFEDTFDEWKNTNEEKYLAFANQISKERKEGQEIKFEEKEKKSKEKVGDATYALADNQTVIIKRLSKAEKAEKQNIPDYRIYPKISPDGLWLSYLEFDYGGTKKLIIRNYKEFPKEDGTYFKVEASLTGVTSYDWSPDSSKIVLSKVKKGTKKHLQGFSYNDLVIIDLHELIDRFKEEVKARTYRDFTYDMKQKKKFWKHLFYKDGEFTYVTEHLRAEEVAWSHDGTKIAFIRNNDGKKHLGILDLRNNNSVKYLIEYDDDTQVNAPSWSPDDTRLVFSLFRKDKQNIWTIDVKGTNLMPLTFDDYENRDPYWATKDTIFFVTDRTGIFNIYEINLASRKIQQVTNVLGGAFMPYFNSYDETIFYSYFTSYGFKLFKIETKDFLNNNIYTTPEREDRGTTKSRREAYETVRRSDETRSNEGMRSYDVVYIDEKGLKAYLKEELEYPAIEYEPYNATDFLSIPKWKNFIPLQLVPEMIIFNSQVGFGLTFTIEDYLSRHSLRARFFYDEDENYLAEYTNNMWYPEFNLSAAQAINRIYVSNIYTQAFLDQSGLTTNPDYYAEYKQDIVKAGATMPLGDHSLSLEYNFRDLALHSGVAFLGADTNGDGTGDIKSFKLLRNNSANFTFHYKDIDDEKRKDHDISPRGLEMKFDYVFTYTDLNNDIQSMGLLWGNFDPADPRTDYFFHTVRVDIDYKYALKNHQEHTFGFSFDGSFIDKNVDPSDELYLGGKSIFKTFRDINTTLSFPGYDGYSIIGETRVLGELNYNFPLATDLKYSHSFFYLDDIYGTIFAHAGNAWDHGEFDNSAQTFDASTSQQVRAKGPLLLYDAGFELRMKSFIFHYTPWFSFFTVAYGFQNQKKYGFNDEYPVRIYAGLGSGF